jgi:hypothetical protein
VRLDVEPVGPALAFGAPTAAQGSIDPAERGR